MAGEVVFLFGAGASYGAGHISPCRPPLGVDLYDRLVECFPQEWGPGSRLAQCSDGFQKNFEKTMNEVCEPSLNILPPQQKMALYFSKFTPDLTGRNLYSQLLLFLRNAGRLENSIFGSLNYDCIFEQAAHRLSLEIDYCYGEGQRNGIHVLKVHGSCHFITENIRDSRYLL